MTRALIALCAFSLLGPVAPACALLQQAKGDEVILKSGDKKTGKIVGENYDALQLEIKKGSNQPIKWEDIAQVKYNGLALEFSEAMEARASDPQGALTQFEAVVEQEGLGEVQRQTAMMELAALQQRLGALDDAIRSWQALLAAFPEGRYLGVAARGLVDCNLAKGDPAAAGKAIDALSADPAASKFEALQPELKALRGRILMAQEKWADARTAFEQVAKDSLATAGTSAAARLGVAESLKSEGKGPEAEALFKGIVEGEGPSFLLAGGWNGLGDLLSKRGADTRNAELLLEALYAYLRGVVQYAPGPGEPQDEYERALDGSARTFRALGQLESNKDKKAGWEASANKQLELLRRQFPNSKYIPK